MSLRHYFLTARRFARRPSISRVGGPFQASARLCDATADQFSWTAASTSAATSPSAIDGVPSCIAGAQRMCDGTRFQVTAELFRMPARHFQPPRHHLSRMRRRHRMRRACPRRCAVIFRPRVLRPCLPGRFFDVPNLHFDVRISISTCEFRIRIDGMYLCAVAISMCVAHAGTVVCRLFISIAVAPFRSPAAACCASPNVVAPPRRRSRPAYRKCAVAARARTRAARRTRRRLALRRARAALRCTHRETRWELFSIRGVERSRKREERRQS